MKLEEGDDPRLLVLQHNHDIGVEFLIFYGYSRNISHKDEILLLQ